MGFGMTTVLLNLHNAGFFPNTSVVLAMGVFFGGLAQVTAGIMEFFKGNTFGVAAFTSYGFFWLSLVATWVMPTLGWAEAPSHAYMGCYLALWGAFTFFMFLGTLKSSRVLQFVFLSLTALFFLLAARDFTGSESIGLLAGYVGLICGASAMYLSMAEVLHEQHGRKILPF
ncbi:MAG: acetate uptake transporter, partial [Candidatus Adiutrix sp.]|jgi:succinate-acetate transporter protein|nr:acetate uptake transporter [Candidatus Adiutrix sp.]